MNLNDLYEMRDRRDAYQRDYDSSVSGMDRGADHRGLGQELAHERNNIQIAINGRPWKVVAGKGTADSAEERSNLEGMKQWAERKSASSGKTWTVYLTGAEVSEGQGVAEGSLNELSKDTLKSYAKKGVPDMQASQKRSEIEAGKAVSTKDDKTAKTHYDAAKQAKDRTEKRMAGISGAIKRVTNQGVAEAVEDRTSYQVAKALFDHGIKYNPARENDLIKAIGMVLVKELNMSPRMARSVMNDEDFLGDTLGELRHMESGMAEGSLNELSVNTLSDYGKRAEKSNDKKLNKAADHTKKATDLYAKGTASAVDKSFDHEDQANKLHKQVTKRDAGMDRAAAKLGNKFKKGVATEDASWGMAESSQRVDSLVTDALKIMQGATMNDAVAALKTVLGNREYNDRRGHYSFYVRQLMDMYGQQGVAESKLNEFLDPQAVAQDPGLEREPTADVVIFGRMPQDFTFDKVVQALEAVLPREYPPGSSPTQQGMPDSPAELKGSEIAKNSGAVVTTKPLSTAQKVVKEFQARGIKCKLIAKPGMNEGKADYNFDIEDLKRLETIRDLSTLKTQALALISKPSAKPMKPEKVEWFKNALERMNSPLKVIKLMYDLLLSGEGNAVVGSRSSMNPNSYRQRFSEQGMAEADVDSDGLKGKQGEAAGSLTEDLQADDGEYYSNSDKFFGQFEINDIDFEETSPDGMELRGYIDGVNVMAWRFKSAKKVGGWGIYDDSALSQQGVTEAEVDSDGHSVDHADSGEYDYEGDQAKDQLNTIVRAAQRLNGMLDDNENMPEWVQMKITNAADYIDTAADYIESNQEPELAEGDKIGNMDADKFDAAIARLKQLAGAGPLKTVYDPTKRVYRNVPTAVQPRK